MPKGVVYDSKSETRIDPEETQKLSEIASVEGEALYTLKGVFPFDFFPNTVTVYRNKVSIVRKSFFIITQSTNIPIENINFVTVNAGFPFASLEISDRYFSEQPVVVTHLKRSEAHRAMQIIDGLRLAVNQKIDVTKIEKNDLLNDVLKVGVIA